MEKKILCVRLRRKSSGDLYVAEIDDGEWDARDMSMSYLILQESQGRHCMRPEQNKNRTPASISAVLQAVTLARPPSPEHSLQRELEHSTVHCSYVGGKSARANAPIFPHLNTENSCIFFVFSA